MTSTSSDSNVTIISTYGGTAVIDKSLLFNDSPVIKLMVGDKKTIPDNSITLKTKFKYLVYLKSFVEKRIVDIASIDDAFEIYTMAEDYEIRQLLIYCRYYIKEHINPLTLRRIYNFAYEKKDIQIRYYCWIEFDEKCEKIFQMKEFSRCEEYIIDLIVSRPKYKKLKEINLFEYLVNWARTKFLFQEHPTDNGSSSYHQKIREYLNPYINKIRFLSMDSEEFKTVSSHNILTKEEEESIKSYTRNRTLPESICKTEMKRTQHCYESLIVYKNRQSSNDSFTKYLNVDCKLLCSFSPKEDCFLYEIILPIVHYEGGIPVTIKTEAEGVLIHEAEYITTIFNSISLHDPLFLAKDIEHTVICIIDFEKIKFPIKLSKDAKFYIEDAKYLRLKENLNKLNWNKYVIKIRLYF